MRKNLTVTQLDGGKVRIGREMTEAEKQILMSGSSVYHSSTINTAAENAAIKAALGDPRHNKWALAAMSDEELAAWGLKRNQAATSEPMSKKNHRGKMRRLLPKQEN